MRFIDCIQWVCKDNNSNQNNTTMKQIFLFFALLLPFCAFSQLIENFDGPEITSTHPWEGNTELFKINDDKELQLYDMRRQGSASLYIPSSCQLDNEWHCTIRTDYKGTNYNYFKIFLFCQNPNPEEPGEALFIRLGYSKKNLSLCYQSGYAKPEVLHNGRVLFADATEVSVKVISNSQGHYTIYSKTATEEEYVEECSFDAWTYNQNGYFMLICYYSSEHSQDKYIDNIYIKQYKESSNPSPEEPTTAAPLLQSIEEETGNSLLLTFDQAIEASKSSILLSDEEVDELYISEDETILKAVWNNERKKGANYLLSYSGIYPKEGGEECKGSQSFTSQLGEEDPVSPEPEEPETPETPEEPEEPELPIQPNPISPGAILIHEVMAKPGDGPYPEYVELYNPTPDPISLKGCIFQNGNKQKVLPEVTLPSESYAVLYHTDKAISCPEEALRIPIVAFPALNDNGKTLQFKDPSGTLVDEVTYPKAKAGISWERSANDWHFCSDEKGGTPGAGNSPAETQPEKPEEEDPTQPEKPDEPEQPEEEEKPDEPQPPLIPDGSDIAPGTIIFNELLPNPSAGGSEYIELFNCSEQPLSVAGLSIATRKTDGTLSTHYPLSSITEVIDAGGYLLLSKSIEGVSLFYLIKSPDVLHELKLPILANTASTLVLFRSGDKTVIDEVNYSAKWHASSIKDEKGVALERIHADRPTQDPSNWTSATEASGYGTPGYDNSQQGRTEEPEPTSTVEPPVFSDQTGDYAIAYYLDQTGYNCRAFIYDTSGRRVAEVADHELIGMTGSLHWNGNGTDGSRLHSGLYILYVELYHPTGTVKRYKHVFLVK